MLSLVAFTLLTSLVAAVQRLRLPPERRLFLQSDYLSGWLRGTETASSRFHLLVAVLFILSVGVAGSGIATTEPGETFTELYLLAEDDESGDLVADEYPTAIAQNGTESIHLGVKNQEARLMKYTVFVEWQIFVTTDGERTVASRSLLNQYQLSLAPGKSNRTAQQITPPASAAGQESRLTVKLYTGDVSYSSAPPDPYREVHIWITVSNHGSDE